MTVIIEPAEPVTPADTGISDVALAAGAASAEVAALGEQIEENTAVVEAAAAVAESAALSAAETVTTADILLTRQEEIQASILLLNQGMIELAGLVGEVLDQIQSLQPPKEKKPDTAPRRKSDAHRLLYGG